MTDSNDWDAVDAALAEALDLDGDAREAYLAGLRPDLCAAVEPLLRDALRDFSLIDHPDRARGPLAAEPAPADLGGARVGPYQVGALVGEGGMGRVYRAHRADGAFDKTVALKVVRQSLSLAGSDVAARLRRERDLLATLDHPNVARLLDGGETDDGVPYLVTEFVEGEPITAYADGHGLDVRERVRLLAEVARAVDHAHRRFIVHRDLKPSNVLVTEADGAPRPVVLDFGIAKLLAAADDDDSRAFPLTQTGMQMLTPAYAAPELYERSATVTTAADVYGLGALLYELLTGHRPHDDAPSGPPTTEPTRPSQIVTGPGQAPAFDAAQRSRALRGDLDVICLRALHPDPARRYASASDLADDLDRHLDGRPVEARPDSRAYVAGRFVRRNRPAVAAAGVAVLALVAGLVAALVLLGNERAALAEATAATERARQASRLLGDLFGEATPEAAAGQGEVTVRQALDRGLPRVATVEPASLRGYLLTVLGSTYLSIGDFERSDSLLQVSADVLDGSDAAPGVLALNRLRRGESRAFQGDPSGGLPLVLQADSLVRSAAPLDSALAFDIATSASATHRLLREGPEALVWAERAGRLLPASARPGDRGRAATTLARAYYANERFEEAVETSLESVALYEAAEGANGPSIALATSQTAHHLMMAGRLDEAIPYARRAVDVARVVYGPDHTERFRAMALLGQLLQSAEDFPEAAAYLDSTVAIARGLPSAQTPTGMSVAATLAQLRNDLGEHAKAEAAGRFALQIRQALPPEATRLEELVALSELQTGIAMKRQGKPAARAMLASALARIEAFPPPAQEAWRDDSHVQEATRFVGRP